MQKIFGEFHRDKKKKEKKKTQLNASTNNLNVRLVHIASGTMLSVKDVHALQLGSHVLVEPYRFIFKKLTLNYLLTWVVSTPLLVFIQNTSLDYS